MTEAVRPWIQEIITKENNNDPIVTSRAEYGEMSIVVKENPTVHILEIQTKTPLVAYISDTKFKIRTKFSQTCCQNYLRDHGATLSNRPGSLVKILDAKIILRRPSRKDQKDISLAKQNPFMLVEKVKHWGDGPQGIPLGNPFAIENALWLQKFIETVIPLPPVAVQAQQAVPSSEYSSDEDDQAQDATNTSMFVTQVVVKTPEWSKSRKKSSDVEQLSTKESREDSVESSERKDVESANNVAAPTSDQANPTRQNSPSEQRKTSGSHQQVAEPQPQLPLHPGWGGRWEVTAREAAIPLAQQKILERAGPDSVWYGQRQKKKTVSGYDNVSKEQPAPKVHSPRKAPTPKQLSPKQTPPAGSPPPPVVENPTFAEKPPVAEKPVLAEPPAVAAPSSKASPPRSQSIFAVEVSSLSPEARSQYQSQPLLGSSYQESDDSDAPLPWSSSPVKGQPEMGTQAPSRNRKRQSTSKSGLSSREPSADSNTQNKRPKAKRKPRKRPHSPDSEGSDQSPEPHFPVIDATRRYGILGAQRMGAERRRSRESLVSEELSEDEGLVFITTEDDMEESIHDQSLPVASPIRRHGHAVAQNPQSAPVQESPVECIQHKRTTRLAGEHRVEEDSEDEDIPMAPLVPLKGNVSKNQTTPTVESSPKLTEEPAEQNQQVGVKFAEESVNMRHIAIIETEPCSMSCLQAKETDILPSPSTAPNPRPHVQIERTPHGRGGFAHNPLPNPSRLDGPGTQRIPSTLEQASISFEEGQAMEPVVSFQEFSQQNLNDMQSETVHIVPDASPKTPAKPIDRAPSSKPKSIEPVIKEESTPLPLLWSIPKANSAPISVATSPIVPRPAKRIKKTAESGISSSAKPQTPGTKSRTVRTVRTPQPQPSLHQPKSSKLQPASSSRWSASTPAPPSPEASRRSLAAETPSKSTRTVKRPSPYQATPDTSKRLRTSEKHTPQLTVPETAAGRSSALPTRRSAAPDPQVIPPSSPPLTTARPRSPLYAGFRERNLKVPGYEKLTLKDLEELEEKRREFFGTTNMSGGFRPRYLDHAEERSKVIRSKAKGKAKEVVVKQEAGEKAAEGTEGADEWWKDGDTPMKKYARNRERLKRVRLEKGESV